MAFWLNIHGFKLAFPTGRDTATFRDKGTEFPWLSRDKGTAGQAQNLATGRDGMGFFTGCPVPERPGTQSLSIFSYDFLFWNIFSLFGGKKLHPKPSSSLVILAIQLTTLFLLYCCLLVCAQFGQKEKKMQFIAAVLLRLDV